MTRSIASGLAHLHTRNANGSLYRPSVVHRDFNSRNILVKDDLTCCISDFGFALKTFGPRYEWKGSMTLAEYKSLNEVGTIRYMAPEMLEGAVNLRDCETALKQIDIYSLGLVLWELFIRCEEFYESNKSVSPYKQPYEDDIGKMPSLEQMQILVSRQKVRPKFSDAWKRNVSAKIAKDTCEDCWDHDPDARLTAICVEERLKEMSTHRLQSPTVAELPLSMLPMSSTHHQTAYENSNSIGSISNGTSSSIDFKVSTRSDGSAYGIKRSTKRFSKFNLNSGGWSKIRSLLSKGINLNSKRNDELSILTEDNNRSIGSLNESQPPTSIFQQSNLVDNNRVHIKTKHLPQIRPNNLDLALPHINAPNTPESNLLQTPTEPTNSSQSRNYQNIYKRPPGDFSSQQFTIVDESDPQSTSSHLRKPNGLVVSKSANAMKSLQNIDCSDEWHVKRQRSLEVFKDVFGVKGSVERLRDLSERIKTPGDVPKSVRRVRASKTLSLYDDRMMNINASSGSTL